jgi:hypothetical protein
MYIVYYFPLLSFVFQSIFRVVHFHVVIKMFFLIMIVLI